MASADWYPGSFTKNFSWGNDNLKRLYDFIRIGFADEIVDTPRLLFRQRVSNIKAPDYIPLNFFLLNQTVDNIDYVLVDELVYFALTSRHSADFDKLALLLFNLSIVGSWKGAKPFQARPSLWAHYYIRERIIGELDWSTNLATADDIDRYIANDVRYKGETSRKLSTNLAYLFKLGRLREFEKRGVERWWISALFGSLDRIILLRSLRNQNVDERYLTDYLVESGFFELAGRRSIEKDLTAKHFVTLYFHCGGRDRFDEGKTQVRQTRTIHQINEQALGLDPIGVFHPSNVKARSAVPRACSLLARYAADFATFELSESGDDSLVDYISHRTDQALAELHNSGIKPKLSGKAILGMTRAE
jgi:hypothetical protein